MLVFLICFAFVKEIQVTLLRLECIIFCEHTEMVLPRAAQPFVLHFLCTVVANV